MKVGYANTSKKDRNLKLQHRKFEAAGREKAFRERTRPDERWRLIVRGGTACV